MEDQVTKSRLDRIEGRIGTLDSALGKSIEANRLLCASVDEIWKAIESTHTDVVGLQELFKLAEQRFEMIFESADRRKSMMSDLKAMVDVHTDQIKSMLCSMMQMRDAYYHVFPERLIQDARLGEQLQNLTAGRVTDADPKKG